MLFEVLDTPPPNAENYRFDSVAVKEPTFTIDGVFLPPITDPPGTVFFCEVQFQKDEQLYERLLGETSLYFYRNRDRFSDWQVVVIYPSRKVEQSNTHPYRPWLSSDQLHRVYLDELGSVEELPLGVALMVLTTLDEAVAPQVARELLARSQAEVVEGSEPSEVIAAKRRVIIEMVSTIMIYKFTHLSRREVEAMLDLRLEETRVYREAKEEGELIGRQQGRLEGELIGQQQEAINLILRQLSRRLRQTIAGEVRDRLSCLAVEALEALAEDLLDFTTSTDLDTWLDSYRKQQQVVIERIVLQLSQQVSQPISTGWRDRLLRLSIQQLEALEAEVVHVTAIAALEPWLQSHHA